MAKTLSMIKKKSGAAPKVSKGGAKTKLGSRKTAAKGDGKGERKKYRAKPGTVALREIRKLQKSTQLHLQKAPFQRLVRASAMKALPGGPPRFQMRALYALQEATEAYAVQLFEHGVMLQLHRKRKTLTKKDLEYVRRIRGELL